MSTQINVNVAGSLLLQQNRDAQVANRQGNVQKDADKAFSDDVKAIEEAAGQRASTQSEGAVPEYRVVDQTSAQRAGYAPYGWSYRSYEDVLEQVYIDKNKYRIAVGSADGKVWKYIDTELATPSNAREVFLTNDETFTEAVPVQTDLFSTGIGSSCNETLTVSLQRVYSYQDTYDPNGPFLYASFVIPVNDFSCILVGSVCLKWQIIRSVQISSQTVILPEGYFFTQIGEFTYYATGGCVYNPIVSNDYDDEFTTRTGTYVESYDLKRTNFAFLISPTQVKQLDVPAAVDDLLQAIYPTPVQRQPPSVDGFPDYGWDRQFWTSYDLAALGVGFNVSNLWGYVTKGAPSIFDIFDNGNNFNLYQDAVNASSNYSTNPPLFAADSILKPGDSLDTEINNFYSAFYFGAVLTQSVYVPREFFPLTEAPLNEYIYLPSIYRAGSDYYAYANEEQRAILAGLQANPSFAFIGRDLTQGEGISQIYNGYNVPWSPTNNYRKKPSPTKLSGGRQLPPALFNPDLPDHPMVKKQLTNVPSVISTSGRNAYSDFRLDTIFYTGWGRSWLSKLRELGFEDI